MIILLLYLAHINSRSDNGGNFEVEYRQWEQDKEEESKKVGVLPKNLIDKGTQFLMAIVQLLKKVIVRVSLTYTVLAKSDNEPWKLLNEVN